MRVPVVVASELRLELHPAVVAHNELEVVGHVILERVFVVETPELELEGQLRVDGRALLLEVVAFPVGSPGQSVLSVARRRHRTPR